MFEAVDTSKLLALMAAGAIFAAAGLYLLLRPKPQGGSAKIELFGLKFESSSAGLLVFLIGAAFLAIPLFVPEKPTELRDTLAPSSKPDDIASQGPVLLPARPDAKEVEPNDRVQDANQLLIGATASGRVRSGNIDWYVISTAEHIGKRLVIGLRLVEGSSVIAKLYNADEIQISHTGFVNSGAGMAKMELVGDKVFVQISSISSSFQGYEVFTRVEDL